MALNTFSIFYYGLKITGGTSANNNLNFLEPNDGNVELTAVIDPGTYTYSELITAITTAMNAVGDLDYTVTVDRDTQVMTIASTDTFELLIGTGSQKGISPFVLLGFTGSVDLTGASTYTGDSPSGDSYSPQFILQDYDDKDNFKERNDPSVNVAASGEVEVVSFGLVSFYRFGIKFITNLAMDGKVIKNNPTGVADARRFFESITERGAFEIMTDISNRSNFSKVILDALDGSRTGTGYRLKELTARNLPGYYEVNNIKLRVFE
jgi:hypothetical protein